MFFEYFVGDQVIVLETEGYAYGYAAQQLDDRPVADPGGFEQQYFVAGFDQGGEGDVQRYLAAGGGDDFRCRIVRQPFFAAIFLGDRLAQLRCAFAVHVVGEAFPDRVDRCVLDVLRGVEIRVAAAEIHDVDSFLLKLAGAVGNSHRAGAFNRPDDTGTGFCHTIHLSTVIFAAAARRPPRAVHPGLCGRGSSPCRVL